ncbi:MAG: alkaline phosphatase family protein [Roseivirga sp.]|nr:alkaline phosphatase family protein [Roseivirga sp.]
MLVLVLSDCNRTRPKEPKLIVIIAVDGFRADLLDRYDQVFTGGFRRLKDEGAIFTNAFQDHGMTVTAAGHTSIGTGTFPSHHGIIANRWMEKSADGWTEHYAVEDQEYQIVGFPDETGMSPKNIMVTGIADWLTSKHPDSRVVSISGKDRAAITMAAKAKGHIYWFDDDFVGFSTSTFYRSQNPDWVNAFNKRVISDYYSDTWSRTVASEFLHLARPDSSPYEADGKAIAFPHNITGMMPGEDHQDPEVKANWMEEIPVVDQLVFDFAEKAVKNLALGQQVTPDMLAISLSATDRIAHRFGPFSLEVLDNLVLLDKQLGSFLDLLDREVGEGNYVLALSADHGFNEAPEYRQAHNSVGKRIPESEAGRLLGQIETLDFENNYTAALNEAKDMLLGSGAVERVFTEEELAAEPGNDSLHIYYQNSYYPGRIASELAPIGIAAIEVKEGYEIQDFGSSHGTYYHYDRQVPLIFYGGNILPQSTGKRARAIDIAPTLANMLKLTIPGSVDGKALKLEVK